MINKYFEKKIKTKVWEDPEETTLESAWFHKGAEWALSLPEIQNLVAAANQFNYEPPHPTASFDHLTDGVEINRVRDAMKPFEIEK